MITFNSDIHHRKSIRLRGYDYSQAGMYFITICTHDRAPLFREIINGQMKLNEAGAIATEELLVTAKMRPTVTVNEFIIMPNHMHVIIAVGARCTRPDSHADSDDSRSIRRAPANRCRWCFTPARLCSSLITRLYWFTDRNDLDDQLFDAFAASRQLLRQEPVQAEMIANELAIA